MSQEEQHAHGQKDASQGGPRHPEGKQGARPDQFQRPRHKMGAVRILCLASGIALVCFVLAHTIVGSAWTAWPFDAQFHWVAWVGPILLPLHIIFVAIQRYRAYKRRKEWEAMPPEQRPQPPRRPQGQGSEAQQHRHYADMKIGLWARWISGVFIVVLLAAHIATNNTALTALLMVAIAVHAFYAMGCLVRDLPVERSARTAWRIVSTVVCVAILAFFLWARASQGM